MPSALIRTELSYPALPLAGQLVDQRFVHPGPLVLRTTPLKFQTPTPDKDQPVLQRSEPSSRNLLIGEQPNPWELILFPALLQISDYAITVLLIVTNQNLGASRMISIKGCFISQYHQNDIAQSLRENFS